MSKIALLLVRHHSRDLSVARAIDNLTLSFPLDHSVSLLRPTFLTMVYIYGKPIFRNEKLYCHSTYVIFIYMQ